MTLNEIQDAQKRISGHVLRTPLRVWDHLRRGLRHEAPIFLKLETLQTTGAFKVRGAANKILKLIEEGKKPSRIVAASAGNHAQAVAFISGKLGIPSTIVMPAGSPLVKAAATRDYGADVVLHGAIYDEAFAKAQEILAQTPGSVYVHAYEDADVIAGQGTMGIEIHEQLKEQGISSESPLQLVVPIGGGGLISGVATSVKSLRPATRVLGVVCEAAPGMALSLDAGKVIQPTTKRTRTLGEGLAVKKVSEMTFGLVKNLVDEIAVVTDDEMALAITTLMERGKLVAEGSGAAGVAAALAYKFKKLDPKIPTVFVLCGGNIDMNLMSNILERGLSKDGRWLSIQVTVEDRPGNLAKVATLIAESGANVLEVAHDRTSPRCPLGHTRIRFQLETRGLQHAGEIQRTIESQGIVVEAL